MKNILILIGGGCAAYGMYLWIDGMRKKNAASSDCGCSKGVPVALPGTASLVTVNNDMAPNSERVAYDASFNRAFAGRGESTAIGAGLTEDVNAFAPMAAV